MSEKQYAAMLRFCSKTKFRKETLLRFCKRTPWLLTGIYTALAVFLLFIRDSRVIYFIAVPAADFVFVTVLRFLLNKPRPFEVYAITPLTKHKTGNSCPSRHTSSAFILGMACLYISLPFGILTLSMACIVGATRILCGLHFIRDVLLGVGISILFGTVGFYLLPLCIVLPPFGA